MWRWITTIIAVFVLALTPVGWDLIAGLMSGEGLSRNIAGGVLTIIMLVLLVLALLEWLVRWKFKAAPNFPPPAQTTISDAQKPDKSEA